MKNMIKKNKVLFLAIAIVLAGGACLAAVLISEAHTAMATEQIVTAEEEAFETAAPKEPVTAPTAEATEAPQATAVNTTLSAEALQHLVERKVMRRDFIIPSLDNVVVNEADTWESIEPQNFMELKGQAVLKTMELSKELFNYEITNATVYFKYYTDTSKNREDFVRLTTSDEAVVCTLAADTLDLIEIDYNYIPAGPVDDAAFEYGIIPDSDREIADSIATVFDTSVIDMHPSGGASGSGMVYITYALKMENGKLLRFAAINGTLYAVGVYPSEAAQQEGVYFDADVQMGQPSASPQDFKKGQPGAGDMTREDALKFYMDFMVDANTDGEYDKPKMTFYIDNSGKRENYWHIDGKKMTMDVASESKRIISLTCDNLWNPSYDLTKVKYESMGGKEYETYVANIMSNIYGKDFKNASNNAVYDYHYCTEDAWMTDGSVYEFMFEDGKLQQVFFYADEECFRAGLAGWKADHEYINSASGETFIPN